MTMNNIFRKNYDLGKTLNKPEVTRLLSKSLKNETWLTHRVCQQARLGLMAGYNSRGGI